MNSNRITPNPVNTYLAARCGVFPLAQVGPADGGSAAETPDRYERRGTRCGPGSDASRYATAASILSTHMSRVNRDPRFAGPHRDAVWQAAKLLLAARPRGAAAEPLRAPMQALRAFVQEFGPSQSSGDNGLQMRIFFGYSAERPGLIRLIGDVLVAAGLERPKAAQDEAYF